MRPKVLLVFLMRFEEAPDMRRGIIQYERTLRQWEPFLDDEARTERDPEWLQGGNWRGVISRHTTPELVEKCAKLKIPLVDLNDTPPFPGVPKIRPDNVAIGHLGAEHFLERGFCISASAFFETKSGRAIGATVLSRRCVSPVSAVTFSISTTRA